MGLKKSMTNLCTPHDIAKRLRIGYRNVLELIGSKRIRAIKIGNLYRVTEYEVQKFINQHIINYRAIKEE